MCFGVKRVVNKGGIQSSGHFMRSKSVNNEMWRLQDIVKAPPVSSVGRGSIPVGVHSFSSPLPPPPAPPKVISPPLMSEEEKRREVQSVLEGIDPAEFEDFFGATDENELILEDE